MYPRVIPSPLYENMKKGYAGGSFPKFLFAKPSLLSRGCKTKTKGRGQNKRYEYDAPTGQSGRDNAKP